MGRGYDTSPRNGRCRAPDGESFFLPSLLSVRRVLPRGYFRTICSEFMLGYSSRVSRVAAISAVQQPSHRKGHGAPSKEDTATGAKTHLSVSQTKLSRASFSWRIDVFAQFAFSLR
jgi:hypothetical protein